MQSERKSTSAKGTALMPKVNNGLDKPKTPARGLEMGSDQDDLTLPRVKLLQPLSPEVQDKGLKPGMLVNSISGERVSSDVFIPVILSKEYLKFKPRETGGGLEWRSNDASDPRVQEGIRFGADGEKPEVIACLNYISIIGGDFSFPMIVGFSKTSYKAGRKLYSMARLSGEDLFSRKYRLGAKKVTSDKGVYWVFDVETAGKPTTDEFRKAEELYRALAPQRDKIQAHMEAGEEDSL